MTKTPETKVPAHPTGIPSEAKGQLSKQTRCYSPPIETCATSTSTIQPILPEPLKFHLQILDQVGDRVEPLLPVSLHIDLTIKPFLFSKADVIVMASMRVGREPLLSNMYIYFPQLRRNSFTGTQKPFLGYVIIRKNIRPSSIPTRMDKFIKLPLKC